MVGKFYSIIGNYPKADEYFDLAVASYARNTRPWLEMADSYMRRGTLTPALTTLLNVTERGVPPYLELELTKLTGRYFKLEGDYEQAKQVYAESLGKISGTSVIIKDDQFIDTLMTMAGRATYRIEGTLDYAFHLRRHKIEGASAPEIAATFFENRLHDVKPLAHRAACLAGLAEIHLKDEQYSLAKKYNDAALNLDQTNPKILAAKLSLLLLTKEATPEQVRSQFMADRVFIMQDLKAACSLARTFHLAGMDDLTCMMSKNILSDRRTPEKVRESAEILLHSPPVPPERRIA